MCITFKLRKPIYKECMDEGKVIRRGWRRRIAFLRRLVHSHGDRVAAGKNGRQQMDLRTNSIALTHLLISEMLYGVRKMSSSTTATKAVLTTTGWGGKTVPFGTIA
jgi:hypothetical protein